MMNKTDFGERITKNYEIRCKIIWNIRTKRVAPFSRAM